MYTKVLGVEVVVELDADRKVSHTEMAHGDASDIWPVTRRELTRVAIYVLITPGRAHG